MKLMRLSTAVRIAGETLLFVASLPFACLTASAQQIVYLDQGWSADDRQQFYYTTQGSQLIPYHWFLALEQKDSEELFRTDANMERLRFIPQPPNADRNPDGLPIGLVKDDNPETVQYGIKRAFLGKDYEERQYPVTNAWMGLTCAACHTTQITYDDTLIRIDGGPALADVERFLRELSEAVEATHSDEQRMTRFAQRVLKDTGYNRQEQNALQQRLEAYSRVLQALVRRSSGTHPYGYARLDAFGAILNEICETSLENPANHYPADAPASYPFLWNAPELDWVQWNGSANNPLARNVGEVLGVFAQLNLRPQPPEEQFQSTADIENLFWLEDQIQGLKAPPWPEHILGTIDRELAARGKHLYAENCAHCHAVRDAETNQFPLTPPNALGKQFVRTHMIALEKIGTDPALAQNFAARTAAPAFLMPGTESAPRPLILSLVVQKVIERKLSQIRPPLTPDQVQRMMGYRTADERPPNPLAYKARPLNGIWATAPYLHNGSVPNVDALLRPAKDRPQSFYVGSRQFDVQRVGFVSDESDGAFRFDVVDANGQLIRGNSNAGHEGKYYTQRRLENGMFQDFDAEQRLALIEYLKTLE